MGARVHCACTWSERGHTLKVRVSERGEGLAGGLLEKFGRPDMLCPYRQKAGAEGGAAVLP